MRVSFPGALRESLETVSHPFSKQIAIKYHRPESEDVIRRTPVCDSK